MQINISLPTSTPLKTYQEMKSYLKQLELAVHHAQKSVEHAEKDGIELSENAYICFDHFAIDSDFKNNNYHELQSIYLRINLE